MDKLMLIGDGDARVGMEKYMKNHFPFVGVPKPERTKQTKAVIKQSKQIELVELLQTIDELYNRRERE